jgi:hypothetical protein
MVTPTPQKFATNMPYSDQTAVNFEKILAKYVLILAKYYPRRRQSASGPLDCRWLKVSPNYFGNYEHIG